MRFDGKKPIEFTDETTELEAEALEETKYKLKLPNSSPEPSGDDFDLGGGEDLDLGGGEEDLDMGDDLDLGGGEEGSDKPFDEEPFDAGVEASEEEDPEKYIQQLSGKLGQSIRSYNDEQGEPDFDLEKFAINSVISATNTADMDEGDQDDIIEKIKTSGGDEGGDDTELDDTELDGGEEDLEEVAPMGGEDMTSDQKHARDQYSHSEFPEGSTSNCCGAPFVMGDICSKCGEHASPYEPELGENAMQEPTEDRATEIRAIHFKKITSLLDMASDLQELTTAFHHILNNTQLTDREEYALYDFFNIKSKELGGGNPMVENEKPCWKGYEQVGMKEKDGKEVPNCVPMKESLHEAEYQGKTVKLNKPTQGDVKKYKVYVKNEKGNVVKVNFGDKNMEIKRDNPERRKSFRARHNCSNPGPKWKARYWSCKMWSSTPVSKLVGENLQNKDNLHIFVEKGLKDMGEPIVKPAVKPAVKPVRETRERRTWSPRRESPSPKPKMLGEKEYTEREILDNQELTDNDAIRGDIQEIGVFLGGQEVMIRFINTGIIIGRPDPMMGDPKEEWVYGYDSIESPDGQQYEVGIAFYGHPDQELMGPHIADTHIELKRY